MIKKTGKDYEGETYDVACDRCSTGAETFEEVEDWGNLMDKMQDAGWKKTNKNGHWEHVCPDCEV